MAEGLSPAEQGPASTAPELSGGLSAAAGETAPHPSLYAVEVPPAGRRQIYPIYPRLFIRLDFDLALPAAGRRGDDMVLCFDNGGEVVFRGFVGIAETHPTLHLLPPDGGLLPGDTLAAALVELGEAPALPSDDGLAAPATQPEAPEPPPEPPQAPRSAGQSLPGPRPREPRPAPFGAAPEPDFPVQEILQDLEAQGVVPAPAPVGAAVSAADLVNQVASALPDFAVGGEGEAGPPPAPEAEETTQAPDLGPERMAVVAPEMIGAGAELPWISAEPPVEAFAGTEAAPPPEAPRYEAGPPSQPVPEAAPEILDLDLAVPAALPAPFDVEAAPLEDAPDAVLPGIATPDFAALAAQAGLELPAGPEAPEPAPLPPAPEVGSTAEADEAAASGGGAGMLRSAMAGMLRAHNRILPSRGGEAEDTVAGTRSVLDEEEVLELTEPAEMPLPATPVTLPESAGAPPPPLEEGRGPAQDLDAIELFSDPLSYGAGVMESPAAPPVVPSAMAREPGAGRRLGPQEPLPAAVRDAVRLALHQMDGGDLFDFGAEEAEASEDAAAAPPAAGAGPAA